MALLLTELILTADAISHLAQLILVSAVIAVLLRGRRKATATWLLVAVFSGLAGYFASNLALETTPHEWGRPLQYLSLLAAMVGFLQFTYRVPPVGDALAREAKTALTVSLGFGLVGIAQAVVFFSDELAWFVRLRAVIVVLLAIEFLWSIAILLRRSIGFSIASQNAPQPDAPATRVGWRQALSALRSPQGELARTTRSFALVATGGLVVAGWAAARHVFPGATPLIPYEVYTVGLHLGTLLCVSAMALVFLTYTPEPVRLVDRLTLSVLVMVLLVGAVIGLTTLSARVSEYDRGRLADLRSVAEALAEVGDTRDLDPAVVPPLVEFVAARPLSPSVPVSPRLRFVRPGLEADPLLLAALRTARNALTWRAGSYFVLRLQTDGHEYSVGFHRRSLQSHLAPEGPTIAIGLLATAALAVVIVPFFFRASLVRPLFRLLQAVDRVNQGQRDVVVPVEHNDEIGLLTESFNGMVASIARTERALQDANLDLEERVRFRTAELSETNQALAQRARELAASNAELDSFAHTVAHDLKNPLGVLVAYSELLTMQAPQISPEHLSAGLGQLEQAAFKMNNIIDELLLLATLRKGDLTPQPLDMGRVIEETLNRIDGMVRQHGATVVVPQRWPSTLGHAPWIEEVWVNFLTNAIKYGGCPPYVELGVTLEQECARFSVHDNGPGLSADQQSRLFVPFERLGQARTEGHGLGLSIARRIVETLGGSVSVSSAGVAGQGCTFSFTLPLA